MSARKKPIRDSRLFDAIVYGQQHDLWLESYGRALKNVYDVGAIDGDDDVVGDITGMVSRHQAAVAMGETAPFRRPQLSTGQIRLGRDTSERWIPIMLAWLNASLLICGNTGASKSNLIKYLVLQAIHFARVWISDLYKQEMRHLRLLLGPQFPLIILRPSQMRFNMLQADGDPRTHLSMVLDILQRVLNLPQRAMSILRQVCHGLYQRYDVYTGAPRGWPVLIDVYECVRVAKGLNAAAREAILDRLGAFLVSLTPQASAWRWAWRPSDLTRHSIVFEFQGAAEYVKTAMLSYLMFSVLYFRIQTRKANAALDLIIAFEDAQRQFADRATEGDLAPAEEVAGLIRGLGVSIWLACQSMQGLLPGLVPNLATKVMGRLGSHSDWQRLGADMGMTPEQLQWAKQNLRPGRFIAQLAEGPWRLPFILDVPRVDIPGSVTDVDAADSVGALADLPTVFAQEYTDWQPESEIDLGTIDQAAETVFTLSEIERRFLTIVIENPGERVGILARRAGVSGKRAAAIRAPVPVVSGCAPTVAGWLRLGSFLRGSRGETVFSGSGRRFWWVRSRERIVRSRRYAAGQRGGLEAGDRVSGTFRVWGMVGFLLVGGTLRGFRRSDEFRVMSRRGGCRGSAFSQGGAGEVRGAGYCALFTAFVYR